MEVVDYFEVFYQDQKLVAQGGCLDLLLLECCWILWQDVTSVLELP